MWLGLGPDHRKPVSKYPSQSVLVSVSHFKLKLRLRLHHLGGRGSVKLEATGQPKGRQVSNIPHSILGVQHEQSLKFAPLENEGSTRDGDGVGNVDLVEVVEKGEVEEAIFGRVGGEGAV